MLNFRCHNKKPLWRTNGSNWDLGNSYIGSTQLFLVDAGKQLKKPNSFRWVQVSVVERAQGKSSLFVHCISILSKQSNKYINRSDRVRGLQLSEKANFLLPFLPFCLPFWYIYTCYIRKKNWKITRKSQKSHLRKGKKLFMDAWTTCVK